MASAVEWTHQMETMYEGGARMFIEVGPKRALALFAEQIFEDRPKIIANTNHPKVGGIASFHAALALHALSGRIPQIPDANSDILTEAFRAGVRTSTPPRVIPAAPPTSSPPPVSVMTEEEQDEANRMSKESAIASIVSDVSGFPVRMIHGSTDLLTIGLNDIQISEIHQKIQSNYQVKGSTNATTLPGLVEWLAEVPHGHSTSVQTHSNRRIHTSEDPLSARRRDPYVFSGLSLGLP